jgi:UDP-glucose:(heptosyl)LPS alpha-1,3-glucosyltransferase
MNIAVLRRRYNPSGGAERYLERLAEGLAAEGHRMELWCEGWNVAETALHAVHTVRSADPLGFDRAIAEEKLSARYDFIFSLERVGRCDLYRAGDGVHAEWLRIRRTYSSWAAFRTWIRPKNRAICQIERRLFDPENTGRVIANSRHGRDEIVRCFGYPEERIDVVYNGVPYAAFSQGNRARGRQLLEAGERDRIVLLVGAGAERKGYRYAKAAVAAAELPALQLRIVNRAKAADMPDIYAGADIFLLPTMYDPFANVTLEALAAGLPVITTRHNGASEILVSGESGHILERADEVDKAAKFLRELADPGRRERFQGPAQELARRFDFQRNVRETLEAVGKALRQKKTAL